MPVRIVVNSGEAPIDLALAGAGLACDEQPVHLVSLAARHVLPKVRVFAERVAGELAAAAG